MGFVQVTGNFCQQFVVAETNADTDAHIVQYLLRQLVKRPPCMLPGLGDMTDV